MKFRCERDLLVDALSIASKAVTNRGTLPVLHGLRLDLSGNDLVITGSDLDLTITVSLEVGGEKMVLPLFRLNYLQMLLEQ